MPVLARLTPSLVKRLPFASESTGRIEYRDSIQPGLVLRVGRRTKTYYFYAKGSMAKSKGGDIKIRLGDHRTDTLPSARQKVEELLRRWGKSKEVVDATPTSKGVISVDLNDELLTTEGAARLTKMSTQWFEKARYEGRGGPPYLKRGRAIRYLKSQLLAWWIAANVG